MAPDRAESISPISAASGNFREVASFSSSAQNSASKARLVRWPLMIIERFNTRIRSGFFAETVEADDLFTGLRFGFDRCAVVVASARCVVQLIGFVRVGNFVPDM